MISDLRLHGSIGPVEYFAFVGGASAFNTYFYEEGPSSIRFFSKGNEFTMTDEGIHYKGTGGSFCGLQMGRFFIAMYMPPLKKGCAAFSPGWTQKKGGTR